MTFEMLNANNVVCLNTKRPLFSSKDRAFLEKIGSELVYQTRLFSEYSFGEGEDGHQWFVLLDEHHHVRFTFEMITYSECRGMANYGQREVFGTVAECVHELWNIPYLEALSEATSHAAKEGQSRGQ